jgi:hypothetical protein
MYVGGVGRESAYAGTCGTRCRMNGAGRACETHGAGPEGYQNFMPRTYLFFTVVNKPKKTLLYSYSIKNILIAVNQYTLNFLKLIVAFW